jgi:competence protein ComEC
MGAKPNIVVSIAVAWLVGIWLARLSPQAPIAWAALALVGGGAAAGFRRAPRLRTAGLVVAFLALGALRFALSDPSRDTRLIARYNDGGPVTLVGVVDAEPSVPRQLAHLRVKTERLRVGDAWTEVHSLVLVWLSPFPAYAYGDRLELTGRLVTPPEFEDFSYRAYLANQGIYSILDHPEVRLMAHGQGNPVYAALLVVRQHARATISRILPEPEASVLRGVLLGDEQGLDDDLQRAFSATGTSHILVVSGYNISILAGAFAWIGRRLVGRRRATPLVIAAIVAYTLLVGGGAAVVRAAIMGVLVVFGAHFGRQSEALIGLSLAAMLMTLVQPTTLWDVGFQLSAMATLGLIVLVPQMQAGAERVLTGRLSQAQARSALGLLNDALIVSFAAQLLTWPIIGYNFGQASPVSLPANFLVLVAQPWVMGLGGAATLAGMLVLPIGQVLGWLAWLPLAYTVRVVEAMARLPLAEVPVGPWSLWMPAGYYAGLVAGLALLRRSARYYPALVAGLALLRRPAGHRRELWQQARRMLAGRRSDPSVVVLVVLVSLAGVAALTWSAALSLPDGRLHVACLDVGQGDAIFVRTPSGRQVLIDGGPDLTSGLSGIGRRMAFWDRDLDLVVLTHPDNDHLTGLLPVLERYRVGQVLEPGRAAPAKASTPANTPAPANPFYGRWQELLDARRVPVVVAQTGTRLLLGDGIWAEVLNPPDGLPATEAADNDASVVLRLGYGRVTFLLTGDLEEKGEARLLASGVDLGSTVLKVSHHGSKTGTTARFVAAVAPAVAVISVGADNKFGHPSPEVLARLAGVPVYRTDQRGTVEMVSDGERLWVRMER